MTTILIGVSVTLAKIEEELLEIDKEQVDVFCEQFNLPRAKYFGGIVGEFE
jgi:hypothetical protein